jgi:hypothetical protein
MPALKRRHFIGTTFRKKRIYMAKATSDHISRVMSGKILPFGSWVESHYTHKAKVRHSRERAFMLERHEQELDLALLKDTYPREQAFDDGADTTVRPKRIHLTSAQFAEMSRLMKGARSQKEKDNIRRSYQGVKVFPENEADTVILTELHLPRRNRNFCNLVDPVIDGLRDDGVIQLDRKNEDESNF